MYFANVEGNAGSCTADCNFQQFGMTEAFALMPSKYQVSVEMDETYRSSCLSFSKAQASMFTLIPLC